MVVCSCPGEESGRWGEHAPPQKVLARGGGRPGPEGAGRRELAGRGWGGRRGAG